MNKNKPDDRYIINIRSWDTKKISRLETFFIAERMPDMSTIVVIPEHYEVIENIRCSGKLVYRRKDE